MPEKRTLRRARRARAAGKKPSTQAGEFVREEIRHVRRGKHGARSAKQAIAIGLSKARRAGVKVKPRRGRAARRTRRSGAGGASARRKGTGRRSARRPGASRRALRREGRRAASSRALSRQARRSGRRRRSARSR